MPWREVLSRAIVERPVVRAERCVHTHAEVAACRRCVDVCPRGAWRLDDAELAIDAAACDGCGLCVAHCPQGALTQPTRDPSRLAGVHQLTLACERVSAMRGDTPVACVNAVSQQQVAALYAAGLRHIAVRTAECQSCLRHDEQGLVHRLLTFNDLVAQRRLPCIGLSFEPPAAPRAASAADASSSSHGAARRGFMRRLFGVVDERARDGEATWAPPGTYLDPPGPGDRVFCAPQIDVRACDGCDACVRICPQGALTLAADGAELRIRADRCSGCRLCADVCDRHAVTVVEGGRLDQSRVELHQGSCRSCGARYHRPQSQGPTGELCQVCARVDHRRNLFQVL